MRTFEEKLKIGDVRIEGNNVIGLGSSNSALSLKKIDTLFEAISKSEIIEVLSTAITAVALINSNALICSENEDVKKVVSDCIAPLRDVDVFELNEILKAFN